MGTDADKKGGEMGQIANQMLAEWCCRMAEKLKEKRNSRKSKGQNKGPESAKTAQNSTKGRLE